MSTAAVQDLTPLQFRRRSSRLAEDRPQLLGIFADMTDGTVVAQFFLNFAGFNWNETKFFMLIAGLCGKGDRTVEMFDKELADVARCTDRTIRSWRAAYLAKAQKISYWPLKIVEGDYQVERKRYEATAYSIPAEVESVIERAVVAARAMPEYEKDRLKALEQAADEHYEDIPDAPGKRRTRKPKKSLRSPVIQSIENARKSLDKGKKALEGMPARMRDALLAGQGEDLREMLLAIQGQIDDFLSVLPQDVDKSDVSHIPEVFSGTPQVDDRFRVKEDTDTTRKRSDEPEHPPEAISTWERIEGRLTKRQIQTVQVELVAADLPPVDSELAEVPDEDEVRERIAVMVESGVLDNESATDLEQTVSDSGVRAAFYRQYMASPRIE
jgi:hypothetical protein